jgi:hypothetical protein
VGTRRRWSSQPDQRRSPSQRLKPGLVQVPSALRPIGAGDPHEEREGPAFPDGSGDSQREADPIFQAPSVLVRPLIGERGKKLVEKIAVGHVDLHHLETRLQAAAGRSRKLKSPLYILPGHLAGLGESRRKRAGSNRHHPPAFGRGPPRATEHRLRLASGMGELHASIACFDKPGDAFECLGVLIGPDRYQGETALPAKRRWLYHTRQPRLPSTDASRWAGRSRWVLGT